MGSTRTTLWSWLTKSEAKSEIYCPQDLLVNIQEFEEELKKKVEENRLPAKVNLHEVNWDDTNTKQQRILVQYSGPEVSTKIVQFLVGLDFVGNYAYVEEKVYITPPNLPEKPREKEYDGGSKVGFLIFGIISLLFTVSSFIFLFVGIISILIWFKSYNDSHEIWEWNEEAERELELWNKAWEDWDKETLQIAYLASTNDIFGRFTLAMSSTVKQVIKSLFEDRKAELKNRTEQQKTQKEIQEELEKRKNEFK